MNINLSSIGTIHTPYFSVNTPHQPVPDAPGEFWISLQPEYRAGLADLAKYRYIYVIYYLDQVQDPVKMRVYPAWAGGAEVGLFASRSPARPNPIGLSIVEVKEITDNEITISGIDVYNGTPLLDIKPYIKSLDLKPDANDGWYDDLPDKDHLIAHMLGQSHEHGPGGHEHHEHGHGHAHGDEHHHGYKLSHGHGHQHNHGFAVSHIATHPHDDHDN